MIDPSRGASEEALERQKEESYERMRLQLFEAVEKKLAEFEMTWDDLAGKLKWEGYKGTLTGQDVKNELGSGPITSEELNSLAHCFSAEVYIIFRPRFPITQT